jgi:hypothetical protein
MNPVFRALERAAEYFRDRPTRQGLVARRLLDTSLDGDLKLAQQLLKERRAKLRADGSVAGDLVATAWLVWEQLDIAEAGLAPHGLQSLLDTPAIQRPVRWMLGRQDRDGAWGVVPAARAKKRRKQPEGDSIIGGFFAYRGSGRPVRKLLLPNGSAVVGDQACRFLASCFALRTVLRAGREHETLVRRHIGSLLHLPRLWDTWGGHWNPALMAAALAAVAWAPFPFRAQLPILAEHLAVNQKPDGTWRNLDIAHAVEALIAVPLPQARESVALAAPRLAKLQGPTGAVGTGPQVEERTLIALKAWLVAKEYA